MSELEGVWAEGKIPVLIDEQGCSIEKLRPKIVVDAILAKRNLGTHINMADITIALGPGFKAGKDAHVVIETMRGHNLGRLIFAGEAMKNTGVPGEINRVPVSLRSAARSFCVRGVHLKSVTLSTL